MGRIVSIDLGTTNKVRRQCGKMESHLIQNGKFETI